MAASTGERDGASEKSTGQNDRRIGSSALAKSILSAVFLIPLLAIVLSNVARTLTGAGSEPPPPPDFGTGSMFDSIATRYDFINRALALNLDMKWRKVMVEKVLDRSRILDDDGNGKDGRLLDLATGTADVAILLGKEIERRRAVAPGGKATILGVDPSRNMIEVGRNKVSKEELSDTIELRLGDARNLEGLDDSTFDGATMSFGIRNVPEKDAVLCEIHRVLKKEEEGGRDGGGGEGGGGGTLAILEFSEPPEGSGVMGYLARSFIRNVVPVVGAALSGAPREYLHLQNSIKEFPTPEEFKDLMEGLECGDDGRGAFRVDELIQMNFGSVQLYVATPIVMR